MNADTPNSRRLTRWRLQMRMHGHYYSHLVHLAQLTRGIDWTHRDTHGRLRMGPDGYLPRITT